MPQARRHGCNEGAALSCAHRGFQRNGSRAGQIGKDSLRDPHLLCASSPPPSQRRRLSVGSAHPAARQHNQWWVLGWNFRSAKHFKHQHFSVKLHFLSHLTSYFMLTRLWVNNVQVNIEQLIFKKVNCKTVVLNAIENVGAPNFYTGAPKKKN